MSRVVPTLFASIVAASIALAPSSADAQWNSTDPGQWARNRCVSRNVMVAGLVTAPIGLGMLGPNAARNAGGFTIIGAAGATLVTGMSLRIAMPSQPAGVNQPYARWEQRGCKLRALSVWGGPMMGFGAMVFAVSRLASHNPVTRIGGRIGTIAGIVLIGGGLSMLLYGTIAHRNRGDQPAIDATSPLIALPLGSGELALGAGSVGYSGAF